MTRKLLLPLALLLVLAGCKPEFVPGHPTEPETALHVSDAQADAKA